MKVAALLAELADVGRNATTGGYDRFAWTRADADCRAWFMQSAGALGLEIETDRNGNLWAWWNHDRPGSALVTGSHLDSVPGGGAFDGPLGIASAFAAIESLQRSGFQPSRPIAVVAFADEEGARFGVACAGSRLMTGALDADRALRLLDADGISLTEAMAAAGANSSNLGRDDERLATIGEFIELHVEQGHLPTNAGGTGLGASPLGLATQIWPHGRWRIDIHGRQNHAGTTALADRDDPMMGLARVILSVREAATRAGALGTVGKVAVRPGAVNAIPGTVSAWIDARAPHDSAVRQVINEVERTVGLDAIEESWTAVTLFDTHLTEALRSVTGVELPLLPSGAGHDAGVLAQAGIPTAMLLVRNPSGISHSPQEYAYDADCELGAEALAEAIRLRSEPG